MGKLSLSNVFRYMMTGVAAAVVFFICNDYSLTISQNENSIIEISLIALLIGAVSFHLYRSTIYKVILLLIDKFRDRNVRSLVGEDFVNLKQRWQKEMFWFVARKTYLKKDDLSTDQSSSEVHLLLLSSIFCLIGGIYMACQSTCKEAVILLAFFLALCSSGIMIDVIVERKATLLYDSIPEEKKKEIYKRYFTSETKAGENTYEQNEQ